MGLGQDRKVILEKYGPYVRSLAATVRKQFSSSLELDELIAWGQVGLLEAADRFDPRVGANFLTFAHYRIKGAIFDGLRKMGVLRGADTRNSYISERATAYLGNLSDRDGGGGNRRGSVDDDVRDISSAVSGLAMIFATSLEASDGAQLPDDSMPADQRIELEQLKDRVRRAMEKLPEKERQLLMGYYFQNKTLEQAGSEIGQSKSWASRLHARAIERLKEVLEQEDEDEAAMSASEDEDEESGSTRRNSDVHPHGRSRSARSRQSAEQPADTDDPEVGGVEVRRGPRR
ncbi:MAG: sigma-70 family RNA polymerase sigma factor [Myxococcaceae bacterium]